ncbi:hypothetical protein R3P38DRAFT_3459979 [Favolaschia claudopus]|uniref:Transmembrane protein n=1 Tax=Favolaschia claudopus TaxID=2862362 RepID=A0AAV9ZGV3_9AGAR
MLSPRHLLRSIQSFQLGYNPWPQHPYPGRWTTPIIIFLFALLTAFIACINVPLSAYEFIQEVTYRPNDTLPALPLSRWLPSLLQPPTISFQPQVLTVGDTFNLNNSLENSFTLISADDRMNGGNPVSSFSYFNNPFSDGCDVSNMSITYDRGLGVSAQINCDFPVNSLTLSWERILSWEQLISVQDDNVVDSLFYNFLLVLVEMLGTYLNDSTMDSEYSVVPACPDLSNISYYNGNSTCLNLRPPKMWATTILLFSGNESVIYPGEVAQSADNPLPVPSFSNMVLDQAYVSTTIQNMFQMIFHYVRLQMGVVYPNLIYSSAEMYNHSILPVGLSPATLHLNSFALFNRSRAAMANETYFAQMQEIVHLYNTTDRVPVMEYSRTVPKLKPLGSAITSVFVSTFAMLSTIWAVFSLIAGALAKMYAGKLLFWF